MYNILLYTILINTNSSYGTIFNYLIGMTKLTNVANFVDCTYPTAQNDKTLFQNLPVFSSETPAIVSVDFWLGPRLMF